MKEKQITQSAYWAKDTVFSTIKKRLNLQTIAALIRDGSGDIMIQPESFQVRREQAYQRLKKRLESYGEERETILDAFLEYTGVIEEIYFNLGMKAGAALLRELTENFESDI